MICRKDRSYISDVETKELPELTAGWKWLRGHSGEVWYRGQDSVQWRADSYVFLDESGAVFSGPVSSALPDGVQQGSRNDPIRPFGNQIDDEEVRI